MYKLFIFFYIASFFAFYSNSGKDGIPITLHDEKLSFIPKEFYIAGVIDGRPNHGPVASLLTGNTSVPTYLQGGVATGIKQFIDRNLHRDTKLRPVIITIKDFKLTESAAQSGRVNGHLTMDFSFELQRNYDTVHLMNYRGGIRYDRPAQQSDAAEPALRHGIEDALSAFDTWMDEQADKDMLLAKSVKVRFTDHVEKAESDTIYYSVNRPLRWSDFREMTGMNKFEAEVFTSIGYTEQMDVLKGIVNLTIDLKVDLPKNDCRVKAGGRTDYTLNHEQRHFDIEKIAGEHFKQKILAMHLPVDNFDGPINVEYLEALREATRLQKQYDSETHHGMDEQSQTQWNEKIDKELKDLGVKK